jgi:6,7-dimethyl-8-ribityllumazine synthase
LSLRAPRRTTAAFSPRQYEGSLDAAGLRFGIVCARWNPTVTDAMLSAALDTLRRRGAKASQIAIARVPGAFEVPNGARAVLDSRKPDALIALAAIIRGETTHHEILGHTVSWALGALAVQTGVPLGFGILTCDTIEQARERTDKGVEATEAAIEMANLRRHLKGGR